MKTTYVYDKETGKMEEKRTEAEWIEYYRMTNLNLNTSYFDIYTSNLDDMEKFKVDNIGVRDE